MIWIQHQTCVFFPCWNHWLKLARPCVQWKFYGSNPSNLLFFAVQMFAKPASWRVYAISTKSICGGVVAQRGIEFCDFTEAWALHFLCHRMSWVVLPLYRICRTCFFQRHGPVKGILRSKAVIAPTYLRSHITYGGFHSRGGYPYFRKPPIFHIIIILKMVSLINHNTSDAAVTSDVVICNPEIWSVQH